MAVHSVTIHDMGDGLEVASAKPELFRGEVRQVRAQGEDGLWIVRPFRRPGGRRGEPVQTIMDVAVCIAAPETGETLDVFGAAMVVKADPARASFLLAEHIVPPGYAVPPHVHDTDDEYFWILDGVLTLLGNGGESQAAPGVWISLPRGSRHGFRNGGPAPVRFLVLCRPGLQAVEMFRHFDRAGRDGALDPAEIAAIAGQYGVSLG